MAAAAAATSGGGEGSSSGSVTLHFIVRTDFPPETQLRIAGGLRELGGWAVDAALPVTFEPGTKSWVGHVTIPRDAALHGACVMP